MRLAVTSSLPGSRALLALLAFVAAASLSGCTVMQAFQSDPGTDISSVKAGATREQVETLVGQPQREWTTRAGARYCLYRYYAGFGPNVLGAGLTLLMDAASLGMWELITLGPNPADFRSRPKYPLVAVSYDSQDVVIGVFHDVSEFTALPEDGRPVAAAEPGSYSTAR